MRQISYGNKYLVQDDDLWVDYAEDNPVSGRMVKFMLSENFLLTQGNQVEYFPMGEDAFESIFHELEKAEKFILIDFFIVAEGALWDKMHEILKRKIEEGVEVKFMYDDFGAAIRTRKYFKQILEHEGFEVRVFNPIMKYTSQLYMNFRSHQKIMVIDGKVGYTGGFNLADEYANLVERFGVWKDTGIRLAGDAVASLTVTFLQMWNATAEADHEFQTYFPQLDYRAADAGFVQPYADGPLTDGYFAEDVYLNLIKSAKHFFYAATPYLIISDDMTRELCLAAERGVDVRIVTPGIPDKKLVYQTTRSYYAPLVRRGVRIYEYTPGFIHQKQTLCDGETATVGTINFDYRSLYHHFENGVLLHGCGALGAIGEDFEQIFEVSREVTEQYKGKRSMGLRIIQCILRLFAPLL